MPPQEPAKRTCVKGQDEDSILAMQALLKFRTETPRVEKKRISSLPELAPRSEAQNSKGVGMKPKPFGQVNQRQQQQQQLYYRSGPQVKASPMRSPHPLPTPYSHTVHQYTGVHSGTTTAPSSATQYHHNPLRTSGFLGFPENFRGARSGSTTAHADSRISDNGLGGYVSINSSPSRTMTTPLQSNTSIAPSIVLPNEVNGTSDEVNPERKRKRAGKKDVTSTRITTTASLEPDDNQNEKSESVRLSEIEAALRSRPQRGRKRENLSNEERLELTRTRNREHAKSTRMRKKARYQELLDNEEKFKELQKVRDLTNERLKCVEDFLAIRTQMLRGLSVNQATTDNVGGVGGDLKADKINENITSKAFQSEGRTVSFSDGPNHTTLELASAPAKLAANQDDGKPSKNASDESVPTLTTKKSLSLGDVVMDITTFVHESNIVTQAKPGDDSVRASMGILSLKCVSDMKQFDDDLARSVLRDAEEDARLGLSFRVKDSKDGIAINDNGAGFVEVEVTLCLPCGVNASAQEDPVIVVQTAILKVQFAESSNKLFSVGWHSVQYNSVSTTANNCHDGSSPASDESSESLVCQKSFPSVVSLEQSHFSGAAGENSAEKDNSDGGNGLGMHI